MIGQSIENLLFTYATFTSNPTVWIGDGYVRILLSAKHAHAWAYEYK